MRSGRLEEASALAAQIGQSIIKINTAALSLADADMDSNDLWSKVRSLFGRRATTASASATVSAQSLNQHYAGISSDNRYTRPLPKHTVTASASDIDEWHVFNMLDRLKPTSPGLDQIPAWFLRTAAPFFSLPLSFLFNLSLQLSVVSAQWKLACITPIPKLSKPTNSADFRPISIAPILSRRLEKYVVKTFLYPILELPSTLLPSSFLFNDQFAFRPTGSPTAALIALFQNISVHLSTSSFVRVIALDFSKAFDTVRHATLFDKFSKLPLPDHIFNWLINFFSSRSHCTKFDGVVSNLTSIEASVVQGSALGLVSFVINACDLHPICPVNSLLKFADDTYLIISADSSYTCATELAHIEAWAAENNLHLIKRNRQSSSLEILKSEENCLNQSP